MFRIHVSAPGIDVNVACVQAVVRAFGKAAAEYVAEWLLGDPADPVPAVMRMMGLWRCEYNWSTRRLTVVPTPLQRMGRTLGSVLERVDGGMRRRMLSCMHVAVLRGWQTAVKCDRQRRRMRLHVVCACLRRQPLVPSDVRSYLLATLWDIETTASLWNARNAAEKLVRIIGFTMDAFGAIPIDASKHDFTSLLNKSYANELARSSDRMIQVKYGQWLTPETRKQLVELTMAVHKAFAVVHYVVVLVVIKNRTHSGRPSRIMSAANRRAPCWVR